VEELRLAGMLIEAAAGKVDWTAYPDQAADDLKALIEAKLAGCLSLTTKAQGKGSFWSAFFEACHKITPFRSSRIA